MRSGVDTFFRGATRSEVGVAGLLAEEHFFSILTGECSPNVHDRLAKFSLSSFLDFALKTSGKFP